MKNDSDFIKKEELFLSQFSEEILKNINYDLEENKEDFGLVFQLAKYFNTIKDYDNRLKCLNFGLEQKSLCCIEMLADSYYVGEGVVKDTNKCFKLFEISAAENHIPSLTSFGYLYSRGHGVRQKYRKSYRII